MTARTSSLALLLLVACAAPDRPSMGESAYPGIGTAEWQEIEAASHPGSHLPRDVERLLERNADGAGPHRFEILVLSGGGQHGAFGPGVHPFRLRRPPAAREGVRQRVHAAPGRAPPAVRAGGALDGRAARAALS